MFYALDGHNRRISAEEATKGVEYFCPCCNSEVILKRGKVKVHHFAHRTLRKCDEWYEMSDWHKHWQEKFPEQFREIVIEEDGERHRADIKVDDLVVEFQHSNIAGKEFDKRNEFYSKNNHLVWLFDLRTKDISEIIVRNSHRKTRKFLWLWAYKFNNLDYFGSNFDLFFHLPSGDILKVVWNKKGFKYVGGYIYTEEGFMEYLRRKYKRILKEKRSA